MSAPLSGLVLDYVRDLLDDVGRPMHADDICAHLNRFDPEPLRQLLNAAVDAGRLVERDGLYSLAGAR